MFHEAAGRARGALVFVHALAEEMNLCRRMAALQARAFAAAGHAVLQIDLFGCGDSDGDFGDADWQIWTEDIVAAARWLGERTRLPVGFWGLRAGCLLAVEAARVIDEPADFLFWQPTVSGEAHWRQFRRILLAADAMADEGESATNSQPARNPTGEVEIAGYRMSQRLTAGLARARLDLPRHTGRVACVEVGAVDGELSPGLAACVDAWRAAGRDVACVAVQGPAFWQIPEADDCNALLETTAELWKVDDGGR